MWPRFIKEIRDLFTDGSARVLGALATSGATGQKSVNGSAAAVAGSSTAFSQGFYLRNLSTSSDPVFWGLSNSVTTGNGHELPAGQETWIPLADASGVYVICAASGTTKVTYAGF